MAQPRSRCKLANSENKGPAPASNAGQGQAIQQATKGTISLRGHGPSRVESDRRLHGACGEPGPSRFSFPAVSPARKTLVNEFRIDLDAFRGPLDLLLYLVRKHEVDIVDIPIALVTDQYLAHIEVLEQLDVNAVGDFLEMASTLVEIKSRMVLPRGGEETEEIDDPRQELVQQLLEYKKYKDAASSLDELGRRWQQRFARVANDLPTGPRDLGGEPIREVELWDLVSAFSRVLREHESETPRSIVYDETPIHVYMARLHTRLRSEGRLAFTSMFEPGMHKSTLISIFLAILELVRHHNVQTQQQGIFGELWVVLDAEAPAATSGE